MGGSIGRRCAGRGAAVLCALFLSACQQNASPEDAPATGPGGSGVADATTRAAAMGPAATGAVDASASTIGAATAGTPRATLGVPAGWELVREATYSATQSRADVTLRAVGENPSAGYETKLLPSPLRIWPPQYLLARKRPEGMAAQVITPFDASASFKAEAPVKSLTVTDAAGRHEVAVQQAE